MPYSRVIHAQNGLDQVYIPPVEEDVRFEARNGVLIKSKLSETGAGRHLKFIYDVPGINGLATQTNATAQATDSAQTPGVANNQYRNNDQVQPSSPPALSPASSLSSLSETSGDGNVDGNNQAIPTTPSKKTGASAHPSGTPGGKPLTRNAAVLLDVPSFGHHTTAWLNANANSPSRHRERALNGTWEQVLDSLPPTQTRQERRALLEKQIEEREYAALLQQADATWEAVEDLVAEEDDEMGAELGGSIDESDLDSEDTESMDDDDDEHDTWTDSERMVEDQLRVIPAKDQDMDDLYVGDDEYDRAPTPLGGNGSSFSSSERDPSQRSWYEDQFGNLYRDHTPMPVRELDEFASEHANHVDGNLRYNAQHAAPELSDSFLNLSGVSVSSVSSFGDSPFPGFPQRRDGVSAPASSPSVLRPLGQTPAGLQRFVTPDGIVLERLIEPGAPTRERFRNISFRTHASSGDGSSVFTITPTPVLSARAGAHYGSHRFLNPDRIAPRKGAGGPDRRKKTVRWRDPTPLPSSREVTPAASTVQGQSSLPIIESKEDREAREHQQRRAALSNALRRGRAPELTMHPRRVLLGQPVEISDDEEPKEEENQVPKDNEPIAGPSGVGRTDSLKENVKPPSLGSGNRVPFASMLVPVVEVPVLTQVYLAARSPKTPASAAKARATPGSSPRMTRSRAKREGVMAEGDESVEVPSPRCKPASVKGKGKA